ncbi:MAG: type III-A CRISPR-associated protein Cas10/Csm1 [Nitrospirae bacterium]|nr:type III-A CRISPR-associated protein Cas10/Csm1 [Nitrospirota bacterium]
MDETVFKIAIAAFLHDIGKFAERASVKESDSEELVPGFHIGMEFLNNNRDLYQPHFKGNYTHLHAVYTAAFIDHFEKILPSKFNRTGWGLDDSFINLAAKHHLPETPLQWIVAVADRVSSGFDRKSFEQTYNTRADVKDYKKVRLASIFEQLARNGTSTKDTRYRYPLGMISPANIFPGESVTPQNREVAEKEYRDLLFEFVDGLEKIIKTGHGENVPLWFDHFDSLFMLYASHIPAATVGQDIPDVSLYDHSRMTSAIASALYLYHKETGTLSVDNIKSYEPSKLMLINGEFYGIQNFIFTEGGSTGKASAKLLRGRSFYVSLLSELAADMICRRVGLPSTSIILNAAGKFTILAPNTESIRNTLEKVEDDVNRWLISNFYGEASIGLASVEASCNDFVSGSFPSLLERLSREIERRKFKKVSLEKYGGVVTDYLDGFDNRLGICPFCNRRPATDEGTVEISRDDRIYACRICTDHVFIGTHLVKQDRIAITVADADITGKKLLEPLFGQYQLFFPSGKLLELARHGRLLKYWDISVPESGVFKKDFTTKFINGYVPKYDKGDESDEMIDRYLHGEKTERKQEEILYAVKKDLPKTFHHIAKMALNRVQASENGSRHQSFEGIEAIGVFKADVDHLGQLFATGLPAERLTLSRLATMSRLMNQFFAMYVPHLLKTEEKFKDIYTVFAGGDDLFLIGPWNRTVEFAGIIYERFREYVCYNPDITLSAGLHVCKPNTPVLHLAKASEEVLDKSKSVGRDRITVFGEAVTWKDFTELEEIRDTIERWKAGGVVNNAMLYRLNRLLYMAECERKLVSRLIYGVSLDDLECLKWQAMLKYTIVRNMKNNEKLMEEVLNVGQWIHRHGGAFKIPLWQVIYNHR